MEESLAKLKLVVFSLRFSAEDGSSSDEISKVFAFSAVHQKLRINKQWVPKENYLRERREWVKRSTRRVRRVQKPIIRNGVVNRT
jgi:hypothetical protein